MRRRNRPPAVVLSTTTAAKVCTCGAREWTFSTNGDGASVQCCTACGVCTPFGRHWQDVSVGVRVIAFSFWSSLTPTTKSE